MRGNEVNMSMLSPSVLGVDYLDCTDQLKEAEAAGADMLHIDVMDGSFVPNISFGAPVLASFKKHSALPMDVHLMIDEPSRYISDFAKYADYICIHFEAEARPAETLKKIRELGCKAALAIKPATAPEEIFGLLPLCDMVLVMSVEPGFGGQSFMPNSLDKLRLLKQERERCGLELLLEVDGGINTETGKACVEAGADILVAGSYIFGAKSISEAVKSLKIL